VTTISEPKPPAEEEVGGMEAVLPTEATAALAGAHTPQDRARDRANPERAWSREGWRGGGGVAGGSSSKHARTGTDSSKERNGELTHNL